MQPSVKIRSQIHSGRVTYTQQMRLRTRLQRNVRIQFCSQFRWWFASGFGLRVLYAVETELEAVGWVGRAGGRGGGGLRIARMRKVGLSDIPVLILMGASHGSSQPRLH